jgi:hypothetical protein
MAKAEVVVGEVEGEPLELNYVDKAEGQSRHHQSRRRAPRGEQCR